MYEGLDYSVYRKVAEYYQGGGKAGNDEDGYGESCDLVDVESSHPKLFADMRKALPRDKKRETVRDGKIGRNTLVNPE